MDSDQDNQNQLDDDAKQPEPQAPKSNVDGFVVSPHPSSPVDMNEVDDTPMPIEPEAQTSVQPKTQSAAVKSKSLKGPGVLLVVFIILFIAAATAAAYFCMKDNKAKTDLKTAQNTNAQLQVQLKSQSSAQSQVTTLTKQNTTLQTDVNTQKTYITSLGTVAQQLKTKCGTSCSSIVIPTAPTITTTQ